MRRGRQMFEDRDHRRHHVARQRARRGLAHRARIHPHPVGRHHVAEDPDAGCRVGGDRDGRAHPGHRGEDRLHLSELHAIATDLDLRVDAPREPQRPVGPPRAQVPRPVHPGAGAERIRHEPARGKPGPVQVAACQLGTGDVQFTHHAGRRGMQPLVEYADRHARQRVPDRTRDRVRRGRRAHRAVGDVHTRLGDPVHVRQQRVGVTPTLEPPRQLPGIQHLTTEYHVPQPQCGFAGVPPRHRFDQLPERARGLTQDGHALVAQQGEEVARRSGRVAIDHHDGRAVQQRAPHFPHREIECIRMEHRPHVRRVEPEERPRALEQGDHAAVRHRDPLGSSRGAGRVDDVRGCVRSQPHRPVVVGDRVRGHLGDRGSDSVGAEIDERDGGGDRRQPVRTGGIDEDARRSSIGEQEGDALVRVLDVDGYVGGPRADDRGEGDRQVHRPRHRHGHPRLRPDSALDQPAGQTVRSVGQLPIRQPGRACDDGDRLRVRRNRPGQQVGESRRCAECVRRQRRQCTFGRVGDLEISDHDVAVRGDRVENAVQTPAGARDGRVLEQITCEMQCQRKTLWMPVPVDLFPHTQLQFELRDAGVDLAHVGDHARQLHRGGHGRLQFQQHLDERGVRR